jgi:hypothetical protein
MDFPRFRAAASRASREAPAPTARIYFQPSVLHGIRVSLEFLYFMTKHPKPGGGHPPPKPNGDGTHAHKTDISGTVDIRGIVQTKPDPSFEEKRTASEEKRDARDKRRLSVEMITLGALILYAAIAAVQGCLMYESNKITREALTSVQRASVFFAGTGSIKRIVSSGQIIAIQLTLQWENGGTTPTRQAKSEVNWKTFPGDIPADFDFQDVGNVRRNDFFISPKTAGNATETIPIGDIISAQKGKTRLFVWGWITYRDIFSKTPLRLTEFCDELTNIQSSTESITDPSANITADFSLCITHNCSDEDCKDYKDKTKDM